MITKSNTAKNTTKNQLLTEVSKLLAIQPENSGNRENNYDYILSVIGKLANSVKRSEHCSEITYGEWLDKWLNSHGKMALRPNTYITYEGYVRNHIKPQLGKICLSDITTLHLQQFYNYLLSSGRVKRNCTGNKPAGLSPKTVWNIHTLIFASFEKAIDEQQIFFNPARGCTLPKSDYKEMNTLKPQHINIFLHSAKSYGLYEFFYTELSLGLRRGELLGLKWCDVDFDSSIITIRRQIVRQAGKTVEAELKTHNSYRSIVVSDSLMSVLQYKYNKSAGESLYVFSDKNGNPMSPESVLGKLHKVLRRAGLPKIRFHDLRHTFAMLALQNGVDVKTLSGILGHYSASFTLDTYGHVSAEMYANAAGKVGNYLDRMAQ